MKILRKIGKIFLFIFLVIAILFVVVFIIRKYNYNKYVKNVNNAQPFNYKDINAFPKNVGDITIKKVEYNSAQGLHLVPKEVKRKGLVVTYGGSEGSSNYFAALEIAKHGYEVLSMFMFGQKNQPKNLVEVPLEQFKDVYDYAVKHCEDASNITIYAGSKGAEYALNLANYYKEIKHLILFAPSSYNFSGLDMKKNSSSWSYGGKPLPFIDYQKSDFLAFIKNVAVPSILNSPISFLKTYDSAIEMDKNKNDKKIAVSKNVDILLFAGADDKMWPSSKMAKEIYQQNKEKIELNVYEKAGHIFSGDGLVFPFMLGGSEKDNQDAQKDSTAKTYVSLEKWHPLSH